MKLIFTLKKTFFVCILMLVLLIYPKPSLAQDVVNCSNPQTTLEMKICASQDYEKSDKKLNQVYQQLKPKLRENQRKKLVDAQRTWIDFRDKNCDFEASGVEGGTLEPVVKLGCLTNITNQRVKDLQRYSDEF